MVLIEDDSILHPEINSDSALFISGLKDDHRLYTRFFDALLIQRLDQPSFFRDLRAFREQPQVIDRLDRAGQDKTIYREVTVVYLGSRYAHPWCRKTPSKTGFWHSASVRGMEKDADIAKEEERLHKLLVPIWITMRWRMFPGEEIVKQWCIQERKHQEQEKERRLLVAGLEQHDKKPENKTSPNKRTVVRAPSIDSADEDEAQSAAHAAQSVFRLAAAGIILSQTPKRKLRWLTRKP